MLELVPRKGPTQRGIVLASGVTPIVSDGVAWPVAPPSDRPPPSDPQPGMGVDTRGTVAGSTSSGDQIEVRRLIEGALPGASRATTDCLVETAKARIAQPGEAIFRQGERIPLTLIIRGYGVFRRTTIDGQLPGDRRRQARWLLRIFVDHPGELASRIRCRDRVRSPPLEQALRSGDSRQTTQGSPSMPPIGSRDSCRR